MKMGTDIARNEKLRVKLPCIRAKSLQLCPIL